ncbi:MAG: NAD-dependent epimerase/dehydratase family protein [Vicinamibacteria bacterium]
MKALVTGGGGFLGGAIVRLLRERGDEVRSFARGAYPALEEAGVEVHRGDLGDAPAVSRAVRGMDVVFHVAALPGVWGPYEEYHRANVTGTENVLAACRGHEVRRLVFTSTPSVVHGGSDIEGGDESLPYAATFSAHYPRTKAMAERMVLAADGERLSTVALRPHLVWGPGDNHLVPRIVARGRAGRLRLIGDRPNVVDTVYVDNAADAHLAAADRLAPEAPCAGKAYFISNGEPLPLAEITNGILAAAGLPPVTKRIPVPVAIALGGLAELVYAGLRIRSEPPLTRFVARQLSTAHWFDISAARRDLGYEPRVSIEEGLRRLAASFSTRAPAAATNP